MVTARRFIADAFPYAALDPLRSIYERGRWPCRWISLAPRPPEPFVAAYRCRFECGEAMVMRVHVTADERYVLYCDGRELGRGPERGSPDSWAFESYEFDFPPGPHVIVAQVWSLGLHAPRAQMSIRHGFLFSPEGENCIAFAGSGHAAWEAKALSGFHFERPFSHDFYSRGSNVIIDGSKFPWNFADGSGDGWQPVESLHQGASAGIVNRYPAIHLLTPGTLPPMRRERFAGVVRFVSEADGTLALGETESLEGWQRFVAGTNEITVSAGTRKRVLIDFSQYRCGEARVVLSGGAGARLRLHWAESLYQELEARTKGNRDEIGGKYFVGVGDTLLADGGARREWCGPGLQAGRFLQIEIATAAEMLTLHTLVLQESRYPLEMESEFAVSDPRMETVARLALRSLQSCCHDAYIDGPYYEQMMWIGDSRLKALVNYTISTDDQLARKALSLFDQSRLTCGFTRARWPARDTMIIAPYSLLWVGMVYDYALWRGDAPFIRSLQPGVRAVLDAFGSHANADGLIVSPPGWNFVDWVPGWSSGIPPGGDGGVSAVLNWQYVLTLTEAAAMEDWLGEGLLAARLRHKAAELAEKLHAYFWVEEQGMFADDLEHRHFSEHTQALAVLSRQIEPERGKRMLRRCESPGFGIARTTIYFSHYLFEAYAMTGMSVELTSRLDDWFTYEKLGLTTLPESPEPTRSDCHGWSAHVLYHYFATLLGIRPQGMGFERVSINPMACGVERISGSLIHPRGGRVEVKLEWDGDRLAAKSIILPEGLQQCS